MLFRSPGLKEQHGIQLQILESTKGVEIELMTSVQMVRPVPEPDKPYASVVAALAHPWSRGTIVSLPFLIYIKAY